VLRLCAAAKHMFILRGESCWVAALDLASRRRRSRGLGPYGIGFARRNFGRLRACGLPRLMIWASGLWVSSSLVNHTTVFVPQSNNNDSGDDDTMLCGN